VGRRRYGLFVAERARLPVVLEPDELRRVHAALPGRVRQVLQATGVDESTVAEELASMGEVVFARTRSRSLIGSLNEFVSLARAWINGGRNVPALELSLDLAEVPVGPLDGGTPVEAIREVFGMPVERQDGAQTELAVQATWGRTAICRRLVDGETIHLRAGRFWEIVPGEIVTVRTSHTWEDGPRTYLAGVIQSHRIDALALGVAPLRLEPRGTWDPIEEYWGDDGEPIDDWAKPIIARGPRPCFEMEQVLPGWDADGPDDDPICRSVDCKDSGNRWQAHNILMALCEADIRCLDAHAHLGNLVFDFGSESALSHYEVGVRIGELSLGTSFNGVLPWGWIDNRPFLRCLSGYGLCLWRLRRFDEAAAVFARLLWLNPSDNQGVRFLIDPVRRREAWRPE
jgi:hypothetical protein